MVLLNLSTHPYFAAYTWTNPSAGNIVGTSDTAGAPIVAALTVAGVGAGTVTDFSDSTANSAPGDLSATDNYSTGALPGGSDTLIFANHSVNVCWGLALVTPPAAFEFHRTFKGLVGLLRTAFATSADAATVDTSKEEYRTRYLTAAGADVDLNPEDPTTTDKGSKRIMVDTGASASVINIHETDTTSQDSGFPLVRILANHASTNLFVREARGGVGIAVDDPSETATLSQVFVTDQTSNTKVQVGEGTTLTTWKQLGGNNRLNVAATITTIRIDGGTLTTEGDYTVTTGTITDGTWLANHIKTAANCITTLNVDGDSADVDTRGNGEARTIATLNHKRGDFQYDRNVVTVTAWALADTARAPAQVSVRSAA